MVEHQSETSGSGRLFTLLILALVIAALYFAKEILLPLALAVLLSFVLTPMVSRLERLRLGRIPSVVIVCIVAFTLLGSVGWLATSQIVELSSRLPDYKDNLIEKIHNLRSGTGEKLEKAKQALEDIGSEISNGGATGDDETEPADRDELKTAAASPALRKDILKWLNPEDSMGDDAEDPVAVKVVELPPSPLNQIQTWLGPLVAPLSTAGMVIVLVIFILIKREDVRNRMIQLFGTSKLYATTEAIEDATDRLSRFLRMQLLINVIYGVVVAGGLFVLDVPNAALWGVLGTMLRFLPYVGPWIAAAMPILLTMATSDGWSQPLMAIGLFVVLELIVNNVLEPWLYGSSIGVSSLGVIVAAIFWTWLWGPIGLVMAMPLTVCLVVLGKYVPQLEFLPILLGDRSALRPSEHMYQRLLTDDDAEAAKIAEGYLQEADVTEFYNDVMLPALQMAERDRHADRLSEEQETIVNDSARELVEQLGERLKEETELAEQLTESEFPLSQCTGKILCVPVRDQADETVALMAGQLLRSAGCHVDVESIDTLAGELLHRLEHHNYQTAVLTMLPPLGARKGRYLCKRLRKKFPNLNIIVALFNGAKLKRSQQRLRDVGADEIATTLPELVQVARQTRFNIARGPQQPAPDEEAAPQPAGS